MELSCRLEVSRSVHKKIDSLGEDYWPSLFDQDRWILAFVAVVVVGFFLFGVFKDLDNELDRTSLVNNLYGHMNYNFYHFNKSILTGHLHIRQRV